MLQISLAKVPTFHRIALGRNLSFGGVMQGGRCCDRESFPRTRLSGSRLSWPKLAKARSGWCRPSIGERRSWLFLLGYTTVHVVGCCPGVQALTVRRRFVVTLVDMLAAEVSNIQARVWEGWDCRWCESRAWRFVDVNDLISCRR